MSLKPELHGYGLTLRPLGLEHAQALFESSADPESNRLTGSAEEISLERYRAFYQRVPDDETRLDYGIFEDVRPERLCGEVVINGMDREARTGHFRVAISNPLDRDRGLGTRATRVLLRYVFDVLGLERLDLEVYSFNPRAIHVYEGLGFVRTGLRKGALEWEGQVTDLVEMQLTPESFVRD